MSDKTVFAQKVQMVSTTLASAVNDANDMVSVYFDRGYNVGGGDPISDSDVVGRGITAANVTSFITLSQQLNLFAENGVVVSGDYDSTLNILRTDL